MVIAHPFPHIFPARLLSSAPRPAEAAAETHRRNARGRAPKKRRNLQRIKEGGRTRQSAEKTPAATRRAAPNLSSMRRQNAGTGGLPGQRRWPLRTSALDKFRACLMMAETPPVSRAHGVPDSGAASTDAHAQHTSIAFRACVPFSSRPLLSAAVPPKTAIRTAATGEPRPTRCAEKPIIRCSRRATS